MTSIFPIRFPSGIKRDSTRFDGDACWDGEWVRWVGGRVRKILGYRNIASDFSGYSRASHIFSRAGYMYVHSGNQNSLERKQFDYTGAGAGIIDRTPGGFVTSTDNMWTLDDIFDAGSNGTALIAHAGQNLTNIDQDTDAPIYYGDVTGTSALTAIPNVSVSGGIVSLAPYLFGYGSDGKIIWSVENEITNFTGEGSGSARITGSKIVKGLRYRGGPANSPAGLFWSLDSLLRVSFVGGQSVFRSDTLSDEISVLAQNSIISYDSKFFWIASDRFMMFDGTVREVPNNFSLDYFFNNLNFNQRQKIWAIKNPRFGEIWWFAPMGTSTECNHIFILNVREQSWYDTPLPQGETRSSGVYRQVFPYPIMFGADLDGSNKVKLWQHEFGYDKIDGDSTIAIRSFFETPDVAYCATGGGDTWTGQDRWVGISRIEPDFVLSGGMTVTPVGNKYAQGDVLTGNTYSFDSTTEKIDIKEQYRQMRLRFESNQAGGYYQMGQSIMTLGVGDGRQ
jgi:hypothetical protein